MSRSLGIAVAVLLLGVVIGVINGRVETANDIAPKLVATEATNAGDDAAAFAKAVVVNGETHDFGVMEQSTKKRHTFIIRNDGKLPLKLTKGSTTCKCTMSEVGRELVPFGETAEVTLEWEAKTGENEFSQSAEIHTNEPGERTLRLVVHGKVRQSLKGDRSELVFNQVLSHEEHVRRLNIYSYLYDDFKITEIAWSKPNSAEFFEATVTPLSAEVVGKEPGAKAGVEAVVTLKPGMPIGVISQIAIFKTNLEGQPEITFPIVGKVVGDISLTGPKTDADKMTVYLGSLEKGDAGTSTVYLLVKGPHRDNTTIRLAETKPAGVLKAELGEPSRDNPKIVRYPLTLSVAPGTEPINLLGVGDGPSGEVIFETNHPHVPRLEVKVKFLIKDEIR